MNLEFKGKDQLGNRILKDIKVLMIFKAAELDKVTYGACQYPDLKKRIQGSATLTTATTKGNLAKDTETKWPQRNRMKQRELFSWKM